MTSTSHCFEKHDLNPENCKFYTKCPDDKVRNENFRCVKKKGNVNSVIRTKVEKRKTTVKQRLTDRADNLTSMAQEIFRNGNATVNSNGIRTKLMRLKRQAINKGIPELTENLTSVIERINEFRKSRPKTAKTPKARTSRRKNPSTDLKEFNSFEEDLRLNSTPSSKSSSKSSSKGSAQGSAQGSAKGSAQGVEVDLNAEERSRLNSPNSPPKQTEDEQVRAYANAVSKMASMMNFSKFKKPRKPKQTLKSRKNAESKPRKGTSLNGPSTKPRASRRKKVSQNDISL